MSCEKKRKRSACDEARNCVWVPGMGCQDATPPRLGCAARKRAQCEAPCLWVKGKGCRPYEPSDEERSLWPAYAQRVWEEKQALSPNRRREFLRALGGPGNDDLAFEPSVRAALAAINKTDLRFLDQQEKKELARHVVTAGVLARLQPGEEPLSERLRSSFQCDRQETRSLCDRLKHCVWSSESGGACRERSLFRTHSERSRVVDADDATDGPPSAVGEKAITPPPPEVRAQTQLSHYERAHQLLAAEPSSAVFARGFEVDLEKVGRHLKHQAAAREAAESRAHGKQLAALRRTEEEGRRAPGTRVPLRKNLLQDILVRFEALDDLEPVVVASDEKLRKELPPATWAYLEAADLRALELSVRAMREWMDKYRETYGLEDQAFANSKVLQGDYDTAKRFSSLIRVYEKLANKKRTVEALSVAEKKRRAAQEFRDLLKDARRTACPTGVSTGVLCDEDHYCQPKEGSYVLTKLEPGSRPADFDLVRRDARREVSEVAAEVQDALASLFLTYTAVVELAWELAQEIGKGFKDLLASLAGSSLGWGFSNTRVLLPVSLDRLEAPPELKRLHTKKGQNYYSTSLPSLREALEMLLRTAEAGRVREASSGRALLSRVVEYILGVLRFFALLRRRGLGLGQVCPEFRVAEAVQEARRFLRKVAPDMLRHAPPDVLFLLCYDRETCRPRITARNALELAISLTCAVEPKPWLDLRHSPDIAVLAPSVVREYLEHNYRPDVVFERLQSLPWGPARKGDDTFFDLLTSVAPQTDCQRKMCAVPSLSGPVSITSKEEWQRHLRKNHPDKVPAQDKSRAEEVSKIFNALKEECAQYGVFCRQEMRGEGPGKSRRKNRRTRRQREER